MSEQSRENGNALTVKCSPEFQDLAWLAWRAAGGHMAYGPVTIQEGQHLETLLVSERQYREAHAHSQQLRADAADDVARLRAALCDVFDAYDRFTEDRNLYALSCHLDQDSPARKALQTDGGPE